MDSVECKFVNLNYLGEKTETVVIVLMKKGGVISLKPSENMVEIEEDKLCGAATEIVIGNVTKCKYKGIYCKGAVKCQRARR